MLYIVGNIKSINFPSIENIIIDKIKIICYNERIIIMKKPTNRTEYLRTEKKYNKLWKDYKSRVSDIERILKNGVKSDDDNHLVRSILFYIRGKQCLEEWDVKLLEEEIGK